MPEVNFLSCLFNKKVIPELRKTVYSIFNIPVFSVSKIDEGKKYKVLCFVFRIKERLKQTLNVKALLNENKIVNLFFDISLGGGTDSYFEDYKRNV